MGDFLKGVGDKISEFGKWVAKDRKSGGPPSTESKPEKPKRGLIDQIRSETKLSFAQFDGKELDEDTVAVLERLLADVAKKNSTATLEEVRSRQLTQMSEEVARVTCGGEKVIFSLSYTRVDDRLMIEPIVWRKKIT